MPGGLNGLDLAHAVRDHHPELPLVLVSGYSDKANLALHAGFILLTKPYTAAALAEAIEVRAHAQGQWQAPRGVLSNEPAGPRD